MFAITLKTRPEWVCMDVPYHKTLNQLQIPTNFVHNIKRSKFKGFFYIPVNN